MGSVAKSYMTTDFLIHMVKYLRISSYIRKPFLINDFATDPTLQRNLNLRIPRKGIARPQS